MTISEIIKTNQGRNPGLLNGLSAKYAQSLISPGEEVLTAAVANIKSARDSFPGVVVLTDQRVLAVCGLPGIKRSMTLPVEELEHCDEVSTVIQYKATFRTSQTAFSMTINPDEGEKFSPYIARLNGENFDTIQLNVDGNILNPNLLRSQIRNKQRKANRKKTISTKDLQLQKKAAEEFDSIS